MKVIIKTTNGQEVVFEKTIIDVETRQKAWGRRIGTEHHITITYKDKILDFDYYELEQVFNAIYPLSGLGL